MIGFNGGLIGTSRDTSTAQSVPGIWTPGEQVVARTRDLWPGQLFEIAAGIYSLRDVHGLGAATVVRIRRSSDSSESDFTAADVTDGTLATWVGAGNDGFVRTWYDQSGGGNHFEQSTSSAQPKLVSSGAVLTRNSRPIVEFNAGTELTGSVTHSEAQASVCVMYHPATVTTGSHYNLTNGTPGFLWGFGSQTVTIENERHGVYTNISNTTRGYFQNTANIAAGSYCYSFTWNGTNTLALYQNTTSLTVSNGSGGAWSSSTDPTSTTKLGFSSNAASFEAHEFIFYDSDTSATIGDIQAYLINYYGIS